MPFKNLLRNVIVKWVSRFVPALILFSCGATGDETFEGGNSVQIRYTEYGVPHITADSFEGAGFGQGWAFARDNLCLSIDHAITLAGERSFRFGPGATYKDQFANLFSGGNVVNFDSDAFYRALITSERINAVKAYASDELRALVKGYARGISAHIASEALPGETCRDEAWFRDITEDDIWRRAIHIPIIQASNMFLFDLTSTEPPTGEEVFDDTVEPIVRETGGGSNAAGFGRDMTAWGGGLSFADPHYAWTGPQRFHAAHLKVPGEYDVFGGAIYNFPVPLLGFNQSMGWSITYVTDKRILAYELALDPDSPTRYRIDGDWEEMVPVEIDVPIKTAEGGETRRKTFWKTRYGFVLTGAGLRWTTTHAYALADPQLDNVRMADQYLDVSRARTVRGVKDALATRMGAPWSNIVAADADGEVFYGNFSQTPAVSEEMLERCQSATAIGAKPVLFKALGLVLNGSDTACSVQDDTEQALTRLMPAEERPWAIRTDFLHNSNDSYWLPGWDASSALEGFNPIIGDERTIRGERTRIGALMAIGRRDGTDGLGEPGVDAARWETLLFSSRNYMAELLLDDLLEDCRVNNVVDLGTEGEGTTFDLTEACSVLGKWDRTEKPGSRGSVVFREFLYRLQRKPSIGFRLEDRYWTVPFDADYPVNTPRGFRPSEETRRALAQAMTALNAANIPLDSRLRDVQTVGEADNVIGIGGNSYTYDLTITRLGEDGLGPVVLGHSYIHIVEFNGDTPQGRFIIPYSQSTNPKSPHIDDMTRVFSQQSLIDVVFSDADVEAAQIGETISLPY